MPFQRPTLQQLDERIRKDITGAVRMVGTSRAASLMRRSVVSIKSRVYAGACHLLYGFLAWLADQRFVHKMEDEFLDAEGTMYGMERKGEDIARGKIQVTGNEGAKVLLERIYQHDSGVQYKVTATNPVIDGFAIVTLEATTPGEAGNLLPGEIVRPVQPIADIHDEAVVLDPGLRGGVAVESDDYYRGRILERKRQPPHGGAWFDYVAWAKEVPGVTRAWCLPMWMGAGTTGVMFMRDNDPDPFPTEEQCKEVFDHIETKRQTTAEVFVFAPVRQDVDITTKLSPDTDETRQAVADELNDFIYRDGEPGVMLRVSRISEAISTAVGEHHHDLIEPMNDIHVAKNALPYMGKIIYVDNPES